MQRKIFLTLLLAIITANIFAQETRWKTEKGWVLKKEKNEAIFKPFFAIGLYGIPGYALNKLTLDEEAVKYPDNQEVYESLKDMFNIQYSQTGYYKEYMKNKSKIVGTSEFPWYLKKKYLYDRFEGDQINIPYYTMNRIRNDSQSLPFKKLLNQSIDLVLRNIDSNNSDFIWSPFDEVASGFGGWAWPSIATSVVYDEIKKRNKHTLVFVNLLGGGEGNSFLFEKSYLEENDRLPDEPPYDLLLDNNLERDLWNFHSDYRGEFVYKYKNGKRVGRELTYSEYLNTWFNNVKETARGYASSGDIFGFNSYKNFYKNPVLAGLTVSAIKNGLGYNVPVWLFFDANGHAKPLGISDEEYVANIKCQIYTSLIHGATGVLFWGSNNKSPVTFSLLLSVIDELRSTNTLFYGKTIESKLTGDIQYVIKELEDKSRFVIVANTSTNKPGRLNYKNLTKDLMPLEVMISKLKH